MENAQIALADVEQLQKVVAKTRTDKIGRNRRMVLDVVGKARELDADKRVIERIKGGQIRPFSRRVKVKFAASGSPSTIDLNDIKPYPFSGSTQQSQQTDDDGVLMIKQIALEFPSDLLLNTWRGLRDNYGVRIIYAGDLKPRVMPLADMLHHEGIWNVDAGVDNASAGSEAVVVGTHYQVQPVAGYTFEDDEMLVVMPQESQVKLELVKLPDGATPTLTGETQDLFLRATFRGKKIATNHENF